MHMSVCACAHMFARAAQSAREHPRGGRWVPMHLGLGLFNPTYLFSRVGFWNLFARGGQRSFQGHSLPTIQGTFLLGANPHLPWFLLGRFHQPFHGNSDLHHVKASRHTPHLDLTARCEGGLGSHREAESVTNKNKPRDLQTQWFPGQATVKLAGIKAAQGRL